MNPEEIKKKKDLENAKKIFNEQNNFFITQKNNELKDSSIEEMDEIKKKKEMEYVQKIFGKKNNFLITKKNNESKDSFIEEVEFIIEITKKHGIISDKIKMLEQQIDDCLKEDTVINRAKFLKLTSQLRKLKKEVQAS